MEKALNAALMGIGGWGLGVGLAAETAGAPSAGAAPRAAPLACPPQAAPSPTPTASSTPHSVRMASPTCTASPFPWTGGILARCPTSRTGGLAAWEPRCGAAPGHRGPHG